MALHASISSPLVQVKDRRSLEGGRKAESLRERLLASLTLPSWSRTQARVRWGQIKPSCEATEVAALWIVRSVTQGMGLKLRPPSC